MSVDNSDSYNYHSSQTLPGWTCYKCGAFVPYNMSHTCFVNSYIPQSGWYMCPDWTKIIELLERIAKAVDAK